MVSNISLKADDDFDVQLYSAAKKKGMSKSAFIRNAVEKAVEKEGLTITPPNINILNELLDKKDVDLVKETPEKKNSFVNSKKDDTFDIRDEAVDIKPEEKTSEEKLPEEKKLEMKDELEELKQLNELKTSTDETKAEVKSRIKKEEDIKNNVSQLDNPIINKSSDANEKNSEKRNEQGVRRRFVIKQKKVNRVNDEEQYGTVPVDINEKVEKITRKLREQEEFNKKFNEIHSKLEDVCKDGKCLRDEISEVKGKLGKIDSICEDGKCLRNEIGELKKWADNIKTDFSNLSKKIIKKEPCPDCSWPIEEASSYCPNCGLEIKEWYDDKGNKLDWKPHKSRK